VTDRSRLLWLSLTGRNFGKRPSEILGIENEIVALDFDLACSLRLLEHDNEAETDRFKILAKMLGAEVKDDQVQENVITV
jgi:hypothetical protein